MAKFYQLPEFQNLQTRFVSGMLTEYTGRYIKLNTAFGTWAVENAKRVLIEKYEAFGLKEEFESSVQLFANRLGVEPQPEETRHKVTTDRPEVADLSVSTRQSLRRANALDMKLYGFARSHFDKQ